MSAAARGRRARGPCVALLLLHLVFPVGAAAAGTGPSRDVAELEAAQVAPAIVESEAIDEPLPVRAARGVVSLAVLLGTLWAFSTRRSAIRWSLVARGLGLQLVFALLVLKTGWGRGFFRRLPRGSLMAGGHHRATQE